MTNERKITAHHPAFNAPYGGDNFTPVEGVASRSVYLVTYDEDLWYRFDAGRQTYCMDTWTKRAKETQCKHMCLRLVPDPMFPRGSNEKPYIAATVEIVPDNPRHPHVSFCRDTVARAILDGYSEGNTDWDHATESEKLRCYFAADAVMSLWGRAK